MNKNSKTGGGITARIDRAFYRVNGEEVPVLHDVEFHVNMGECAAVIGPSGCGKSTFLRILAGLHDGFDGKTDTPDPIGYMPQNGSLLPWLTVFENTVSLREAAGEKYDTMEATELLKELGIDAFTDTYPGRISGGQAQRAALARAFFLRPRLLLLDEPFSALDEATRREIQRAFINMRKKYGVTSVFITHSVDEAKVLGDEIYVFSKAPGTVESRYRNDSAGTR